MRKLLLFAAVAALAVPGAAGAVIVPGKSIGAVRLGMTQGEAEETVGLPEQTIRTQDPFTGKPQTILRFDTFEAHIEAGNTITRLITNVNVQRTLKGVGPGSSRATLRRRHPAVKCSGSKSFQLCVLGRPRVRGAAVTEFALRNGKVSEIRVYRVLAA